MRTKSVGKKKINIVTLGCSKNVYDSEVLMGQLEANGKEANQINIPDCPASLATAATFAATSPVYSSSTSSCSPTTTTPTQS